MSVSGLCDVLDGLEAELALERELGVRVVELDRSLLAAVQGGDERPPRVEKPESGPVAETPRPTAAVAPTKPSDAPSASLDFVFLHDRPLSQGGIEMMAKIVTAMKKTPETAPIIFAGECPDAKVYVILGSGALRRWLPGARGAPGEWVKDQQGKNYLVTYSPEFIIRMGPVTQAVKEIKMKMWTSLKGVMQRVVSS